MFDIGFSELLVIAVVALVVLGPERLPKAARLAGLWVRRARAQWYSVKAELEHDLAADELKRSLRDTQEALRRAENELRDAGEQVRRDLGAVGDDPALPPPQPPADDDARR
jgi:sec-independent protein translocase protein TatB